jgi:hypothetical protein
MLGLVARVVLLPVLGRSLLAQPQPSNSVLTLSASAVPLITRATPTAGGQSLTEAYLAQPMFSAGWRRPNAFVVATVDLEGLTMRRGELTTGMHGEGYVDRRHPHTYLHELMGGVQGSLGAAALSVTAGKGFVPFGSDDPMLRPAVKYPINHHLAQILERAVVVGGARYRFALLEAALFNGDEPIEPSSSPTLSNFGDSWATRLIIGGGRFQVSGGYAFVRSPESPDRQSLDQRKRHASVRWTRALAGRQLIAFGEWAQSVEVARSGGTAFDFSSVLGEAEWRSARWSAAIRIERTERPEEARLSDTFRTARPAIDHSLLGITRWDVATATLSAARAARALRVSPFVEASLSRAAPTGPSVFQPRAFYGNDQLLMVSMGIKLAIGAGHEGMGYYGVRRRSSQSPMTTHQH